MGNSARRDLKKAERARLQSKALEIRAEGSSLEEVAARLGLGHRSTAMRLIAGAIEAIPRENAIALRDREIAKLNALEETWIPAALDGDPRAALICLQIHDRRVRLLNLAEGEAPPGVRLEALIDVEGIRERLAKRLGAIRQPATTNAEPGE